MPAILVMGVSGSGKTTIADLLAQRLGWRLLEGDAFHPPANVAKMRAGRPLTEEARWPWLRAIAAAMGQGGDAVVACSALKRAYRDILTGGHDGVTLVFLQGTQSLIARRMAERRDHFMPAALLDSQFATLEEPGAEEWAVVVSIDADPSVIVDRILDRYARRVGVAAARQTKEIPGARPAIQGSKPRAPGMKGAS